MDPFAERIQSDLRGLLEGDVFCDDVHAYLYASDASVHEMRPLGVVRPRSVADVAACVQYAAETQIAIHPRGAGSGLAGESLGPGLVMDLSRYMRRYSHDGGPLARVQPGVVLETLNRGVGRTGWCFGPDPASPEVHTLGGLLGVDASGSRFPRYGAMHDQVESLQAVFADGSVHTLGAPETLTAEREGSLTSLEEMAVRIERVHTNAQRYFEDHWPRSPVNRAGYALKDAVQEGKVDFRRLLCGSAGTLAIITEATLRLAPLPKHRGVILLMFASLEAATQAVLEISEWRPTACDLLDRRHLSLARESQRLFNRLIPLETEALLLVENYSDHLGELIDWQETLVDRFRRREGSAFDSRHTLAPDQVEQYWRLARSVTNTLHGAKGGTRPVPLVEDMAVPPETLGSFLVDLQGLLKKHRVVAAMYAHAGHGQVHLRPFSDLTDSRDVQSLESLASDCCELVMRHRGTISGEHGDGYSRSRFLSRLYGPLYPAIREIKHIMDPWGVFNPNHVCVDEPLPLSKTLRPYFGVVSPSRVEIHEDELTVPSHTAPSLAVEKDLAASVGLPSSLPVPLQLQWQPLELEQVIQDCNGCGACRTEQSGQRMCPMFRVNPIEEASPRSKANLLRGLVSGRLSADSLSSSDLRETADLCIHCHMCRVECPTSTDIPSLMAEVKAAHVASRGLSMADRILADSQTTGSWGCRFHGIANWLLQDRTARGILSRVFGLASGRKLPRFAERPFLKMAQRRRLSRSTKRSGKKVLYFVDSYANFHDTELAEALVAVFEHNGIAVYVPSKQLSSGMPLYVAGAADRARRIAEKNASLLTEAVRQGYHIVASEPSAALALKREYARLIPPDEAEMIAHNSSEACDYLWAMHGQGKLLLDLQPLSVTAAYHMPCHVRAMQENSSGEALLRLIPGLSVRRVERGCSGMAGMYGLKQANFRNSLRMGWGLISAMRDHEIQIGSTECSACKIQMEQGAAKATIHPLKLLALAYNLMPGLRRHLTDRGSELITT